MNAPRVPIAASAASRRAWLRQVGAFTAGLAAAGVAVDYHCEAQHIHGFMLLEALLPQVCAANYQRIASFLQQPLPA